MKLAISLDDIIKFLVSDGFTALINFITIISIIISVVVLAEIRKLKKHYTFIGRIPSLSNQLNTHASAIIDCLNDFSSHQQEISLILTRALSTLNTIKGKLVSSPLRRDIVQVIKKIKKYIREDPDEGKVRELHRNLVFIYEEIRNLRKDQIWETTS